MSKLQVICVLVFFGFTSGQVTHPESLVIARIPRTARIECKVDFSVALHWYKQRDGEAITRLLHFPAHTKDPVKDDNSQRSKYTATRTEQKSTLTVSSPSPDDDATYYCAVWSEDRKVFGSGTRLYVTNKTPKAPNVAVYSNPRPHHDKKTLLCHAKDMLPDIISFQWQVQGQNNVWTNVKKDAEVLETSSKTDAKTTKTSMMIIDKNDRALYACSYTHETNKAQSKRVELYEPGKSSQDTEPPASTSLPVTNCTDSDYSTDPQPLDEYFGAMHSLYLATWVYTLMIIKSMVYFCAISYFLWNKNMAARPFRNRKAP
ncbi:hypothetical protein ACEWY4_006912 [Coilia grayii]|uniref:Ig-like domain-containing protein n=1 Tax=Coilia grayii TaxID=363190 RepID=A0ABD1KES3_9TELE